MAQFCKQQYPTAPDKYTCIGALRDACGTDAVLNNTASCTACTAAHQTALGEFGGCTAEDLANYCRGGVCKVSIRRWCGQLKNPNVTTANCLGCAGPGVYAGAIAAGGCNTTTGFPLWNDTNDKVPSPILQDECTERPCTKHINECISPTVVWNGAAGSLEVDIVQRELCLKCVKTRTVELASYGCGDTDEREYCKTDMKAAPNPAGYVSHIYWQYGHNMCFSSPSPPKKK